MRALILLLLLGCPLWATAAEPIDRQALVGRHDPKLTRIDPHAPLMIGNGDLAFTADITGLQTFPEQYAATAPLLTMAQWAWHSFPNPDGYTEASTTSVPSSIVLPPSRPSADGMRFCVGVHEREW
jgi:hypothetical protein